MYRLLLKSNLFSPGEQFRKFSDMLRYARMLAVTQLSGEESYKKQNNEEGD